MCTDRCIQLELFKNTSFFMGSLLCEMMQRCRVHRPLIKKKVFLNIMVALLSVTFSTGFQVVLMEHINRSKVLGKFHVFICAEKNDLIFF